MFSFMCIRFFILIPSIFLWIMSMSVILSDKVFTTDLIIFTIILTILIICSCFPTLYLKRSNVYRIIRKETVTFDGMKVSYIPQQLISVFSFNFYVSLYFIAEDVDFEYEYLDKECALRKLNKYKDEHDFNTFNISKKSVIDILMKNSDEVDRILKNKSNHNDE